MQLPYLRQNLSFARRVGRPLGLATAQAMAMHGPSYILDRDHPDILTEAPCYLEIGFGYGEHFLACAEASPEVMWVGAEPYMSGVAHVVQQASLKHLPNIRIWAEDVWELLKRAPTTRFSRVYILFPDPWPKRKHHKRRLIAAENLERLYPMLAPQAELVMATDHKEYAAWIGKVLAASPCLVPGDPEENPLNRPPASALLTRYQRKDLAKTGQVWQFYYRFCPQREGV